MLELRACFPFSSCTGCGLAIDVLGPVIVLRPGDPIAMLVTDDLATFGLSALRLADSEVKIDWGRVAGRFRGAPADPNAVALPSVAVQIPRSLLCTVAWRYSGFALTNLTSVNWPDDPEVSKWLTEIRKSLVMPRPRQALNAFITASDDVEGIDAIRAHPELVVDVWVPVIRELSRQVLEMQPGRGERDALATRLAFLHRQRIDFVRPGELHWSEQSRSVGLGDRADLIEQLLRTLVAGRNLPSADLLPSLEAGQRLIEECANALGERHFMTLLALNDTAALWNSMPAGAERAHALLSAVIRVAIEDGDPILGDALVNAASSLSSQGSLLNADSAVDRHAMLQTAMHVYILTDADRPTVKIAALVNSAAATRSSPLGEALDNALDALTLYDQARTYIGQQISPRPADLLLVETNALNAMTSLLASNSLDVDTVLGQVSAVVRVAESPGINSEARVHALLQAASAIDSLARIKPYAISDEHIRRMVRWVEEAYEGTRGFPPNHAGRIDSASLLADILLSPERMHYMGHPERGDALGRAEQVITESARSLAGAPVTRMHHLQWANVGRFYVANARLDAAIEAYYEACRYADDTVDSALTSATRLAEASAAGDVYQRLIFLLIHVGRAVEAGDVAERSRRHWRRNSDTIPDLQDVIRSRTEQDALLLYAGTCGFGAWAIAYASSALAAAWVATIDVGRLTGTVARLQSATSRQDIDDSLTTAAEILRPGILDNVAKVIVAAGASRLSLIPSGLFASLPIASLESDGRSWSDLAEVTQLVSAAEPLHTGTSVVRMGEGYLVSDPTHDLNYAAVEADSVRRWDPHIHEPAETGLRAWLLDNLPKARHLHLACHARYEPGNPYESHFRLGNGLRLTVADISVLTSNIDLVVASACQTALIGVASTEMAVGLGQTLIATGARGVIAALWDVHDLGTAMVIARFYEELRHDGLAGASLTRAQAYLRNACVDDLLAGLGDWVPQGVDSELRALALSPRYRDGVRKPFASPSQWAALVYIGA